MANEGQIEEKGLIAADSPIFHPSSSSVINH